MKRAAFALLALSAGLCPSAFADDLVLKVDPAALIEVEINGQKVMLEVDPRLPDVLVLNPATARELKIQSLPFTRAAVAVDNVSVSGRIGRPNIRFANGDKDRSIALVFDYPITGRAGGSIGPGAVPWDRITLVLADGPTENARTSTFRVKDPDYWTFKVPVAEGVESDVVFDVVNPDTIFNRTATAMLETAGVLQPAGELRKTPFVLGLTTNMQPVTVADGVTLDARPLKSVHVRSAAPITVDGDSTVVVSESKNRERGPNVIVGRETLAGCLSLSVDRKAKTLSLVCAAPESPTPPAADTAPPGQALLRSGPPNDFRQMFQHAGNGPLSPCMLTLTVAM
jgi:hypothetical protein